MSKYSPMERKMQKLGEALLTSEKAGLIDRELTEEEIRAIPDELFARAEYNEASAEKTGYSNYSYWRSTVRMFFKNRAALVMTVLILVLLAFTMIQPYLPNQYKPNLINKYPMSNLMIANMGPAFTNVAKTAPDGTELVYSKIKGDYGDWLAVTNVMDSIPGRKQFTIVEYGEEWSKAEYNGQTGYVKKGKWKTPENPAESTPFTTSYIYPTTMFYEPTEYNNPSANSKGWLYVETKNVEILSDDTLITKGETQLHYAPWRTTFLFGTNDIGQDLWARLWAGTRTSLLIGFSVALIRGLVGIVIGLLWGYVRQLDFFFTELYNIVDNIPSTIILILASYVMKPGMSTLIIAMCVTGWLGIARFVRNQVLIIRDRDFNRASRCLGTPLGRIVMKNLLPHMVSVIMLQMALTIPGAIGSEVFLTYIGLGLPIEIPSLGNLVETGRGLLSTPSLRYQLIFPAAILSVITICFYMIGNAFADAADPKNHL